MLSLLTEYASKSAVKTAERMFFLCFLLMRGFTMADSPGLLLVIGAELWGFFLLCIFSFFLLSSFFNHKVSGVHLTGRKPSRPQIIFQPSQGLSIISAPSHTTPLLSDILPTVRSVLARALFFLLSSPLCASRSGACSCQFHGGPVLGESPRALETIRRLLPLPQIKKKNKQTGVLGNKPFTSLSVSVKKLNGYYF